MKPDREEGAEPERVGFDGLDKLLEHRVRLATCVVLSRYSRLTFTRLKVLLDETDGSLGAHLTKLDGAGYLTIERQFTGRRPTSWYALTAVGRAALKQHVSGLQQLLDRMKG